MRVAVSTASYVARESGYPLSAWSRTDPRDPYLGGWSAFAERTSAAFRDIEGYSARLDALLGEVAALGVEGVELWMNHLHADWATDEHLAVALEVLDRHGLTVVAYAVGGGDDLQSAERICDVAEAVHSGVLAGDLGIARTDLETTAALLRERSLVLAIENHPEHATPAAIRARLDDRHADVILTTADTGWWGTLGYDAAAAIEELGPFVAHVHLKDVQEVGGHDACVLGVGCVPVDRCLGALSGIGYTCTVTLEHLRPDASPTDDLRQMVASLEAQLD